jgi:hypothetical protein
MSEAPYFIDVPSGRRLEELKTTIRVLPRATPKARAKARRTWPEADAGDFEPEGKLFRDKGTGVVYRRVGGDPQAGGTAREDVSTWFISADDDGDGIVYLLAEGSPGSVVSTEVGEIGGRPAAAHEGVAR